MIKTLDTLYVYYELQDGLLTATYKRGLKVDLEIAREIVKTRMEFVGPSSVLVLIFNQGVISMTKEARDYFSSADGIKDITAAAIVLESPFDSFLGNFFLSVTKPKIPARIFTKTEKALKWLDKFRN